jgi:hypothetical protein
MWDSIADVSRLLSSGSLALADVPCTTWDQVCELRHAAADVREDVIGSQIALLMAQNPRMTLDAAKRRASSLVPVVAV